MRPRPITAKAGYSEGEASDEREKDSLFLLSDAKKKERVGILGAKNERPHQKRNLGEGGAGETLSSLPIRVCR